MHPSLNDGIDCLDIICIRSSSYTSSLGSIFPLEAIYQSCVRYSGRVPSKFVLRRLWRTNEVTHRLTMRRIYRLHPHTPPKENPLDSLLFVLFLNPMEPHTKRPIVPQIIVSSESSPEASPVTNCEMLAGSLVPTLIIFPVGRADTTRGGAVCAVAVSMREIINDYPWLWLTGTASDMLLVIRRNVGLAMKNAPLMVPEARPDRVMNFNDIHQFCQNVKFVRNILDTSAVHPIAALLCFRSDGMLIAHISSLAFKQNSIESLMRQLVKDNTLSTVEITYLESLWSKSGAAREARMARNSTG